MSLARRLKYAVARSVPSRRRAFSRSAADCSALACAPFDAAPDPPGEVDLVADRKRRHDVVLHRREVRRGIAAERAIRGNTRARRAQAEVRARQQARRGGANHGARLLQARAGDRERRALRQRLALQLVEPRVAEALPPRPLRCRVFRRGGVPGRFDLPGRRRVDRRPHVVRPGDATCEQRGRAGSHHAQARRWRGPDHGAVFRRRDRGAAPGRDGGRLSAVLRP